MRKRLLWEGLAALAAFPLIFAACFGGGALPYSEPREILAPVLQNTTVKYGDDGALALAFTFDMEVSCVSFTVSEVSEEDITEDEETLTGDIAEDGKTLTVTPSGTRPGTPITVTLTAANSADNSRQTEVSSNPVMPVGGVLARPLSGSVTYRVISFDENRVARLITGAGDEEWKYVADGRLISIIDAIYRPNAPGTADTIEFEPEKNTIEYTAEISAAALGLFHIIFGESYLGDRIEIKGETLPAAEDASDTNLIVIDVGLPEGGNGELPVFYIPYGLLGSSSSPSPSYSHIRFRVNEGASLVIEADNSAYLAATDGGAGHPCPTGNFRGGCIEVIAGGKLRDGAYEGFPLGSDAVLLNLNGSFLAVGPEGTTNEWYTGWLVGPAGANPRITWDSGNAPDSYLEVRQGKLAISANVTVRKTLGLIYSVWFVDGADVTIDVATNDTQTIYGMKGLFANGDNYKFYGTPETTITVRPGSTLDKVFLTSGTVSDDTRVITAAANNTITITGSNTGNPVIYVADVKGHLAWTIPTPL
ncbi:MAG: hypothetical protein LBQ35_03175 [Spirochaetaceae bacterium]|jgi:hypothetical protein|nr:hypothetical protein [Spirochaetaceae bacterium]